MITIKRQLTRQLLWTLLPLLAIGGVGVYLSARSALLAQFDATLRAKATALTVATQQDEGRIIVEIPDALRRDLQEDAGLTVFQMWNDAGLPIRRSRSLSNADLPHLEAGTGSPVIRNITMPSGLRGRGIGLVFVPAPSEDHEEHQPSQVGPARLVVAADRGALDQTLTALAAAIAAVGAGLGLATLLIVPRVLTRGLAPLQRLADQASTIDASSLGSRFPAAALPGELLPITERLNALLARLEQSFERERQFGADLAHELRTPVAELRSAAELALRWPENRDAHTDSDTLAIARHMEGLVDRLLALLRSERGLLQVAPQFLSLGDLLGNVSRSFAARAEKKGLDVHLELPAESMIESDPVLLRSIVTNLIENAIDYTTANSRVTIAAGVGDGRFSVRVTNPVDQFNAADLPRLFERFWQRDTSRTDAGHSGLGLSLARAFATTLGLSLTATLDEPASLTLSLAGPTPMQAPPS